MSQKEPGDQPTSSHRLVLTLSFLAIMLFIGMALSVRDKGFRRLGSRSPRRSQPH